MGWVIRECNELQEVRTGAGEKSKLPSLLLLLLLLFLLKCGLLLHYLFLLRQPLFGHLTVLIKGVANASRHVDSETNKTQNRESVRNVGGSSVPWITVHSCMLYIYVVDILYSRN